MKPLHKKSRRRPSAREAAEELVDYFFPPSMRARPDWPAIRAWAIAQAVAMVDSVEGKTPRRFAA